MIARFRLLAAGDERVVGESALFPSGEVVYVHEVSGDLMQTHTLALFRLQARSSGVAIDWIDTPEH